MLIRELEVLKYLLGLFVLLPFLQGKTVRMVVYELSVVVGYLLSDSLETLFFVRVVYLRRHPQNEHWELLREGLD